ncbi:MAG TPA: 2-C-methyl-D-erythritol 2,4-cyclodiphosphate synthase [Ectothiorhodospiraceae bacterium]|nr:2-C-methyl-D-erythritol 2,4-cyclodiphosphate synthase [Ectothiorhodospiraceae bacterium]
MRIGHGYDAHRFEKGKKLVLCGVEIPHDQGLLAHSDGDVALHALCDAILGAAALGDIGRHFPDTSAEFAGIDSRILLRDVMKLVLPKGYQIANVDLTILAEAPKLAPHIEQMVANIASDLKLGIDSVNVKATTTEKMGFVGRAEGISAHAVVLLHE